MQSTTSDDNAAMVAQLLRVNPGTPPSKRIEIRRTDLVDRIRSFPGRAVLLCAPAGYGKSTVAAQWSAIQDCPTIWRTVTPSDNDPIALAASLMAGLHAIEPLDDDSIAALSGPSGRLDSVLLPTLSRCVAERDRFGIVIDDAQVLMSAGSLRVIRTVIDAVGHGSSVVITSRVDPDIGLARLRSQGELLELRMADLAMDHSEAAQLLERAGVAFDDVAVNSLVAGTEGWAAGLALAALAAADAPHKRITTDLNGRRHDIAEYLVDEVLSAQSDQIRQFLQQTALLDCFDAELCDTALQSENSDEVLRSLVRANLFVTPIDDEHRWFRYHQLFRDLLVDRLRRSNPDAAGPILRRAASWHQEHGNPDEAIAYAQRCGEHRLAGDLMLEHMEEFGHRGELETYRIWLDRVPDSVVCANPTYAITAGHTYLRLGDLQRARRYIMAATNGDLERPGPDGAASLRSSALLLASHLGHRSVIDMRADGWLIDELERPDRTRWLMGADRIVGCAELILGRTTEAIRAFREPLELAASFPGAQSTHMFVTGYLLLALADEGNWADVDALWERSQALFDKFRPVLAIECIPTFVAEAVIAAHRSPTSVRADLLDDAERHVHALGFNAMLSADLALRTAEAAHQLRATAHADRLGDFAERAMSELTECGQMPERLARLRALTRFTDPLDALTPAEMRVLKHLNTHLTLAQIGTTLYISRTTVKSHVASIYSKLGATNRAEAVNIATKAARSPSEHP